MRKGHLCADARLRSFKKGMLYCKLTVASGIQKGLLHVSLDTVEKRCRGMLIQSLLNLETFQKDLIGFVRSCCFGCADSRFAEPRSSFWEGFNFVCAKPPLRCADSRFGKPRSFPVKETVLFFSLVRKERGVHQRFANLWTPGDDSNLRSIRSFILNDRPSSCNRRYRKTQPSRVSPVRI